MKQQINILHLVPPSYRPDLPGFSGRYLSLPKKYAGHIVCRTSSKFVGTQFGNFCLHPLDLPENVTMLDNLRYIQAIVLKGYKLHRQRPFDIILCYDPLLYGIAGYILKVITSAKLIIEVNGHLLTAGFLGQSYIASNVKKYLFKFVMKLTLGAADAVKCLNEEMVRELKSFIKLKYIFCYFDYVPISMFIPINKDCNYVLFAGHPYYIKGVDILIQAFKGISDNYPDIRLRIVGHNRVDLEKYREMAGDCAIIEFNPPVDYDAMPKMLAECTFFVLPSRSEAMGRVLLEAMASGKAVVASRVGGIPEVVEDGKTGFLFDSENVMDLQEKMRLLLDNHALRQVMGDAGRERVIKYFSEESYAEHLVNMLDTVMAT